MFDEWRKRRKLLREYKEIAEHYAPDFKAAKSEEDYYVARHIFDQETADITEQLERMKTQKARSKAEKWGVEVPPIDENGENWDEVPFTGRKFLNQRCLARINREVHTRKVAYWKQLVEVVVPVLSLLVSLILALVALLK
jgi:hypothetical protein